MINYKSELGCERSCNDTSPPKMETVKGEWGVREKSSACQCLITQFGWLSDPEYVMKRLQFSLQQPKRARWSLWWFFSLKDVFDRGHSLSAHFSKAPMNTWASIYASCLLCIINPPGLEGFTVRGRSDSAGSSWGQTKLRSHFHSKGFMQFNSSSAFVAASIAYRSESQVIGQVLKGIKHVWRTLFIRSRWNILIVL